jgi:hypothetical protein
VLAWSGRHLQVSGDLEVSGPRSDAATAAAIASSIRGHWTGHWGDRSVSVTISVEHRPDERAADTRRSQIYVAEEDHDTDARTPIESGDVSLLPLNLAVGHDDLSRTPAEQFGTLLGHRSHESSPAWRGNLMGPRRGVRGVRVDEENVDDLLEANIGGGDD